MSKDRRGAGARRTACEGGVRLKPPPFEYHAPTTVDEVLALLRDLDDAKVLAGGQSLVPLLSLRLARPEHLVDVNGVAGLAGVEANGSLRIGAATRQRTVERSDVVRSRWPLVAEALAHVGHPPIRNRGTFGGSLAHADPAAELPTVVTALDGELVARSARGERVVPASEFFVSIFETALEPDELLVEVRLPAPPDRTGSSFQEVARRHGDFALVGAAATVTLGTDGTIADARLALSGVGLTPVRATACEDALRGERQTPELLAAAAQKAGDGIEPSSDLHGSSEYRRHLARVVARRALEEATRRA